MLRGEPYGGLGDVVRSDLENAASPIGTGSGGFMAAGNQERLELLRQGQTPEGEVPSSTDFGPVYNDVPPGPSAPQSPSDPPPNPAVFCESEVLPTADPAQVAAVTAHLTGGMDWMVSEGEARSAMEALRAAPAAQRAAVVQELEQTGNLYTLLDNLPEEDWDALPKDLQGQLAATKIEALMTKDSMDWAVTDAEANKTLDLIDSLAFCDQVGLLDSLPRETQRAFLDNLPVDRYTDLEGVFAASNKPERKLDVWEKLHTGRAAAKLAPHDATEGLNPEELAWRNARRADTLQSTGNEIEREMELLRMGAPNGRAVFDQQRQPFTVEDVQALEQRKSLELELESLYDIKLSNDKGTGGMTQRFAKREPRAWTSGELVQLDDILAQIPEVDRQRVTELYRSQRAVQKTESGWSSKLHVGADTERNDPGVGGSNIDIYDRGVEGTGRYNNAKDDPRSGFDEAVAHEVGHVVHQTSPELLEEFKEISGWQTHNEVELRAALDAQGIQGEELEEKLRTLERSRRGEPVGRSTIDHADRTYQVDSYNQGQFVSVDSGAIPEGKAWEYARTNPKEHFAEVYSQAVNTPLALHTDLLGDPTKKVKRLEDEHRKAQRALDRLGGGTSTNGRQAAEHLLVKRAAKLAEARESMEQKRAQWTFFRERVFGTDDTDIHGLQPPEGKEAIYQQYKERAAKCMTPLQLEQLRRQYEPDL